MPINFSKQIVNTINKVLKHVILLFFVSRLLLYRICFLSNVFVFLHGIFSFRWETGIHIRLHGLLKRISLLKVNMLILLVELLKAYNSYEINDDWIRTQYL